MIFVRCCGSFKGEAVCILRSQSGNQIVLWNSKVPETELQHAASALAYIISNCTPSQWKKVAKVALDVSTLSDDDLIKKISSWGGTPKALTENRDMMRIAACVFRADLTLQQNYRFEESATNVAIDCPLTCFDGSGDLHDQDGWAELTSGSFKSHVLAWGHFYFMEGGNESSLTNPISNALRLHYTSSPWLNCVLILDLAGFDQTDKAEYNEQNTGQYFRYLVEEVLKNVSSEILETHQTMSLQWSGQLNWDASRRT